VVITTAAPRVRGSAVVLLCASCVDEDAPEPNDLVEQVEVTLEADLPDEALHRLAETAARSADGNVVHGTGSATASGSIQPRRSGR
jgi:hypothetical protein